MDWSKNPFWDTLNIMLKSSNLKIPLFVFHLQSSFLISLRSSFDLNVIYSQSCGHLEAFGLPISPKTSSQQPCFWRSMKKNTLYLNVLPDCRPKLVNTLNYNLNTFVTSPPHYTLHSTCLHTPRVQMAAWYRGLTAATWCVLYSRLAGPEWRNNRRNLKSGICAMCDFVWLWLWRDIPTKQ